VDALWRALSAEPARRVRVEPFATGFSFFRDRQAPTVEILMVLSAAVLLIACLNLAMLMLSRAALRRHELGIRVALGAGPARLLLRSATEAFLLCGSGGVLGLVFASWAGRWLVSMLYTGIVPTAIDASPDFRVCAFAAAVSCASALIFGLAPIRAIFRIGPADALRASPRTSAGGGARFRRLLTASQIALSLAIVSGALLLVRSLQDMRSADLGFRRDRLLMVRLFLRTRDPVANRAVYYHQLAEAFQRLPGVESVAYSGIGPAAAGEMNRRFGDTDAAVDFAGPGFFRSIGMRVIAGREFTWSDDEHAPPVAIISDGLATRLFPQASAIGRSLSFDGKSATIVGIVGEAELWNPRRRTPLAAYFPVLQDPKANSFWVDIRALRDAARLATPVRRTLDSFGRHTALTVQTLDERMDAVLARERMATTLAGFLAGLAVLLASVGIYAFMRHAVAGRTPEFGVRLAVGASPADLAALVVRDVAALALAGITAGLPLTLWSSRLVRGSIFGIPALDPVVLLIAAATLIAVAFAAAWHPARRAASISPVEAIRAE
jgi:putative ABC transport system permease protein